MTRTATNTRKIFGLTVALLMPAAIPAVASAADAYPTRPVRIIVPFGPGGGTDIQGRLLGKKFHDSMGQRDRWRS